MPALPSLSLRPEPRAPRARLRAEAEFRGDVGRDRDVVIEDRDVMRDLEQEMRHARVLGQEPRYERMGGHEAREARMRVLETGGLCNFP